MTTVPPQAVAGVPAGAPATPARPAVATSPAPPARPAVATSPATATATDGERGSLVLEAALVLPLIILMVLLIFHALGYARDVLLVQEAARTAARVAATTDDNAVVIRAARDAANGRTVLVSVEPGRRRPGDLVHVTVSYTAKVGPASYGVAGRAVSRTEPVIDE